MSVSNHPKAYTSAALVLAFSMGICLTLGFKDFYPDLEARYVERVKRLRRERERSLSPSMPRRRRRSSLLAPVTLKDRESAQDVTAVVATETDIPVGIEGTIGNTPLFLIKSLSEATGCQILGKAEFLNGAGNSPKDRVALHMIETAEEAGLLTPHNGDTIYEGTVGSTGISLATLARAKGYRCHICMPSDMSMEKVHLLNHLGATVERVSPAPITSRDHFVNLAKRRAVEHADVHADGSKGFFADQFESGANWTAHVRTTGPEIYDQTGGKLAAFVAGAGTGGTISGVAHYLVNDKGLKDCRIVLADPQGSGLYNKIKYGVMYASTEREGTRRRTQVDTMVEGIGINRITHNFEAGMDYISDAVKVSDEQAMRMARWLVEKDGIFIGSSSAVNAVAAVQTALELRKQGKKGEEARVVTVLCDSGNRHLSKFWKSITETGLEEEHDNVGILELLGCEAP
jgi:cysteine synthase A